MLMEEGVKQGTPVSVSQETAPKGGKRQCFLQLAQWSSWENVGHFRVDRDTFQITLVKGMAGSCSDKPKVSQRWEEAGFWILTITSPI